MKLRYVLAVLVLAGCGGPTPPPAAPPAPAITIPVPSGAQTTPAPTGAEPPLPEVSTSVLAPAGPAITDEQKQAEELFDLMPRAGGEPLAVLLSEGSVLAYLEPVFDTFVTAQRAAFTSAGWTFEVDVVDENGWVFVAAKDDVRIAGGAVGCSATFTAPDGVTRGVCDAAPAEMLAGRVPGVQLNVYQAPA